MLALDSWISTFLFPNLVFVQRGGIKLLRSETCLQDVLTTLRLKKSSKRKFDILKDLSGSIQPVSVGVCNC